MEMVIKSHHWLGGYWQLMTVWGERTSLCFVLFVCFVSFQESALERLALLISCPYSSACLAALSKLSGFTKKKNT